MKFKEKLEEKIEKLEQMNKNILSNNTGSGVKNYIENSGNLNVADIPSFFLIFNTPSELSEFRYTIRMIMLIFALAGVLLSLIFILLFTTKIRKQISLLGKTTKLIANGQLDQRVSIISKDELGQLGSAFNDMLERLESKEKLEKRYLDIVTIINENPSLDILANLILEKLISATDSTFGAFYLVEDDKLKPISTFGIGEDTFDYTEWTNPITGTLSFNFPVAFSDLFKG